MKTNLTEMRKISRKLWEILRSSEDSDNVFYILSLMLIQHLSFSNENKKKYFKTNKDFFHLMRLNEKLDEEANSLLSHFAHVNPSLKMLAEKSDFTKIARTEEARSKLIRQFLDILTDIQKNIEIRKIPAAVRILSEHLKEYYLWAKKSKTAKYEIDKGARKMLFEFSNNKEDQEIYNPEFDTSDIMYGISMMPSIENIKSMQVYSNNCNDSEFALFLSLDCFFRESFEIKFHLEKKSFLEAPILDSHKNLKKFDLITALPILYSEENFNKKKMRNLRDLLTVRVGDLSEYRSFIYSFLLSSLNDDGVLNMIAPYSFLTAGKSDLRKYLVENDILFHVENLPMNVITGRALDAAFVSINMRKSREIKDMTVFRFDRESKKHLVSNQKIANNKYNLSVSQYVTAASSLPKENLNILLERLDRINSEIASRVYDIKASVKKE